MPIIPHSPEELAAREKNMSTSGGGFPLQTIRGDPSQVVPREEQSTTDFNLGRMSQKERRRGGDYSALNLGFVGAAAQDATGGLIKGLAFIPDALLNLSLRDAEKKGGVPEGTFSRDLLKRLLVAGNYEEAQPLIGGLLKFGKGEELGTGSKTGNIIERTGEFAGLAVPFANALNAMAKASKASRAMAAGIGADTGAVPMAKFVGPSRAAVNPATGRAQGQFAPTTMRGDLKEMVLAPYRARPTNQLGFGGAGNLEMGFGALSGLGAGIEQEVYGGSGLTGGLVAPLALPFAGAVLTKGPIGWLGKKLYNVSLGAKKEIGELKRIQELGGIGAGTATVAREAGSADARNLVAQFLRTAQEDPKYAQTQEFLKRAQAEFGSILDDESIPLLLAQTLNDQALTAQTRATIMAGGPQAIKEQELITQNFLKRLQDHYENKMSVEIGIGANASSTDTATFVLRSIEDDLDNALQGMTDEAGNLRTQIDSLLDKGAESGLLTQTERSNIGSSIQQDLTSARKVALAEANKEANRLGLNTVDQQSSAMDFQRFAQTLRDTLTAEGEGALSFNGLPEQFKKIIKTGAETPNFRLSFQDWKKYRHQMTTEISRLYSQNQGKRAQEIKVLADAWDGFAASSPNLNQTMPKFNRYQQYYQDNVSDIFENHIIIGSTSGSGSKANRIYQTAPENAASLFINSPVGVRQFKKIYGEKGVAPNPDQINNLKLAMRDKATASIYKKDGTFSDTNLQAFINDNDAVLKELDLFDDFKAAGNQFRDDLSVRLAEVNTRKDALQKGRLFTLLQKHLPPEDSASPEILFEKVFKSTKSDEIRELAAIAKSAGVEREWNQLALDNVFKKVYPENLGGGVSKDISTDPADFLKWINKTSNRRMLDNAVGTEHADRLQLLADFSDRVNSVMKLTGGEANWAGAPGMTMETLLDKAASAVGTSIPQMTTRFIAVQEARIGFRTALAYLFARGINAGSTAKYQAVMAEALTNPAFAREIMKDVAEGSGEMAPRAKAMINDFYFQRGIPAGPVGEAVRRSPVPIVGTLGNEPEEIIETDVSYTPQQSEPPPVSRDFNFMNPSDPPTNVRPQSTPVPPQFTQAAPPPDPEGGIASVSFEELFPFDSTGRTISNRRSGNEEPLAKGGIGSLV